jgi:hypothetical protein
MTERHAAPREKAYRSFMGSVSFGGTRACRALGKRL